MRPISNKVASLQCTRDKKDKGGQRTKLNEIFCSSEKFVKWCSEQLKVKPVMNCVSVTNESFSTLRITNCLSEVINLYKVY